MTMSPNTYTVRSQRGLTLVEIMVALVIGLILMAGVIELFVGSKQTYTLHESMSRVQENGRFAIDQLSRDLRMAGHMGCANVPNMTLEPSPPATILGPGRVRVALVTTPGSNTWNMQRAINGSHWDGGGWVPALPAGAAAALPGSDVFTLRGAGGRRLMLTGKNPGVPAGSGSEPLLIPANSGYRQFDIVMVGECGRAAIFQITNDDASIAAGQLAHDVGVGVPGNATANLGGDFDQNAEILSMSSRTYFIGTGASGEPALFQSINDAAAQELVEGVERMRVSYGVGAKAPANYQTGDAVDAAGSWASVVSIRISLLLRSENNVTDASQAYTYTWDGGVEVLPPDRRLRQVFTTTVGLRSWLP
jgi:type IV pilus assembly protein PilW